jgi:hypothetical protein
MGFFKICAKCKENKNIIEFTKSMVDRNSGWCKLCASFFNKEKIKRERNDNINKTYKICPDCNKNKSRDQYSESYFLKNNKHGKCRLCVSKYNEKYKEKKLSYMKQYYEENKEHIKEYYEENKEHIKEYSKQYRLENKDEKQEYDKQYRLENSEELKNKSKEWYSLNKDYVNLYLKTRRDTDIEYKCSRYVSASIYKVLRNNCGSKNNNSSWWFLPYTPFDLVNHIENQFCLIENRDYNDNVWMSWDNWGVFNREVFNINNSITWTWNIDHIIPHSRFRYDSLEHPALQDAWALKNLRPYRSDLNLKKGAKYI